MNHKSANNIVYMDYRTSATSIAEFESSAKPDSLANIIKNNNILYNNDFYIARDEQYSKEMPY